MPLGPGKYDDLCTEVREQAAVEGGGGMKDRYERRHRRTARNPACVQAMASGNFDAVPPLADTLARPLNLVAVVNGHHIYRDGQLCVLWTPGVGWWGFALSEADARRTCETVAPPNG